MAKFTVRPQLKILKNNPLLPRWILDGPFGKREKQLPFFIRAKNYLLSVSFWTGEETGKKATASDVAPKMKSSRDDRPENVL